MSRRWRIVLTVGFVAAVVLNGAVLYKVTRPEWAPLGPYPTQTIGLPITKVQSVALATDNIATATYPTLTVTGDRWPDVPVSAEKCAHETVTVTGAITWRSVEPPGSSYTPSGSATALRTEGCTRFNYSNQVPAQVRDRARELATDGRNVTLWTINGNETPHRDGEDGATQPWTTETFAIVWEQ